jgi:hypothetical protein
LVGQTKNSVQVHTVGEVWRKEEKDIGRSNLRTISRYLGEVGQREEKNIGRSD